MIKLANCIIESVLRGEKIYHRVLPVQKKRILWSKASEWSIAAFFDQKSDHLKNHFPGSGKINAYCEVMVGSRYMIYLWRDNMGYYRSFRVKDNTIDWKQGEPWSDPVFTWDLELYRTVGDVEAFSMYVLGNLLVQNISIGGAGFSREVPILQDVIHWGSASVWRYAMPVYALKPQNTLSGLQSFSSFALGDLLWQEYWKGGEGRKRSVPVVDGAVDWPKASDWSSPVDLTGLPGTGQLWAHSYAPVFEPG